MPQIKTTQIYNLTSDSRDGEGTIYNQDGGIGSCGDAAPDSAKIVALSNSCMFQPKAKAKVRTLF
jgi:hypothetical protein